MEDRDKAYKKLRFGLTLKKLMEKTNNYRSSHLNDGTSEKSTPISFRELESESGIRHASIVQIVNGKKNPSWSTIDALLEGLKITLGQFASIYDTLTEKEILEYQKEIEMKRDRKTKASKNDK